MPPCGKPSRLRAKTNAAKMCILHRELTGQVEVWPDWHDYLIFKDLRHCLFFLGPVRDCELVIESATKPGIEAGNSLT